MLETIKTPCLIDSHCHLNRVDLSAFNQDMQQVLTVARDAGVAQFLCVCVEPEDIPILQNLAETYPNIYTSVGVHPNTELPTELSASELVDFSNHPSCIAIGETGVDYFRVEDKSAQANQQNRFRAHIEAAITSSKPLIIHTRAAAEDTLSIMKEMGADEIGGVMHCFAEDWDIARQALDLNFYISFSGIVTFKNAKTLHEVAQKVPADRFLIETDSPYLAPDPFRGKPNHPALVHYVAKRLAVLRDTDYETIATQSTENFYRCFRLPKLK